MSYIKKIRTKIGKDKFIHPGARIIIENEIGEVLFIRRMDNGKIGLPAGALEEDETIEECIKREVKEETGLTLMDFYVIGISTNPAKESVTYPNGDEIQYFTIEFYSNNYEGELNPKDKNEIKSAQFLHYERNNELPENERNTFESLAYYRKTGKILLG
jgi:ADP-ribose pyrophosphatase YjhB (NUDIX family)